MFVKARLLTVLRISVLIQIVATFITPIRPANAAPSVEAAGSFFEIQLAYLTDTYLNVATRAIQFAMVKIFTMAVTFVNLFNVT